MTPEERRIQIKLNHAIFIARGIEATREDVPQWVRTDARKLIARIEEAQHLQAFARHGFRELMLPGFEEQTEATDAPLYA